MNSAFYLMELQHSSGELRLFDNIHQKIELF